MKSSEERMKRREQIAEEIMTSKQVIEYLGFSRVRLNQIVKEGRITPIRLDATTAIYLKDDMMACKQERGRQQKSD